MGNMRIAIFYIKKNIQAIRNEPNTTPLPIIPARVFDRCFLPRPLIKNPINGKKGIIQTICKTLFIFESYQLKAKSQKQHAFSFWLLA